jgi:hypothetical protein
VALIGLVEECKRIAGQLHCAKQKPSRAFQKQGAVPAFPYESIRPPLEQSLQINAHNSQYPIAATLPVSIHLEDCGAMPFDALFTKGGNSQDGL